MRTPNRVIAVVVLTALLSPKAFAPIYGGYPGLPSLIKQSDIIAAVTVLEQLSEEDMGGSARYKIRFDRLLKGNSSEKQTIVYIRFLECDSETEVLPTPVPKPTRRTFLFAPTERLRPFRPDSRWILFLTKPREGIDALYENVNCMGSSFPLSPYRDLDALKVDSLADTLVLLFREVVDYKRTELKDWEKQLDVFIRQRNQ